MTDLTGAEDSLSLLGGRKRATPSATPHPRNQGQAASLIKGTARDLDLSTQKTWRWLTYKCQALGFVSTQRPGRPFKTSTFGGKELWRHFGVLGQGFCLPQAVPTASLWGGPWPGFPSSSSVPRNPRSQGLSMFLLSLKHLPKAEPHTATPGELGSPSFLFPFTLREKVCLLSALEMASQVGERPDFVPGTFYELSHKARE